MLRTIAILLCGGAGLLALSCAPARGTNTNTRASTSTGSWQVEVHLYSGRPNPTYALTDAEAQEVEGMLAGAAAVSDSGEPVLRSVLGYRGITLTRLDSGKPTHLVEVKGTRLALRQGAERSSLATETPSLEHHLLDLALNKGAITQGLYDESLNSR